jgi:hypothetical protein
LVGQTERVILRRRRRRRRINALLLWKTKVSFTRDFNESLLLLLLLLTMPFFVFFVFFSISVREKHHP